MMNVLRGIKSDIKRSQSLKKRIFNKASKCKPCVANSPIPRTTKPAIPTLATPNITVTPNVMQQIVQGKQQKHVCHAGIWWWDDAYLPDQEWYGWKTLTNDFSRWISIFNAPVYTNVVFGTNISVQEMDEHFCSIQLKICRVATETPFSIGPNERSQL